MLIGRILRLTMWSVKREILDRILHAVCDLSKIDPICNYYPIIWRSRIDVITTKARNYGLSVLNGWTESSRSILSYGRCTVHRRKS